MGRLDAAAHESFVFFDFDTIGGVEYLIAQNSYGESYGDKGRHYFPRETINREFAKFGTGLYVFKDLTLEQIADAKKDTPLGRLQRAILDIWWSLAKLFGRV